MKEEDENFNVIVADKLAASYNSKFVWKEATFTIKRGEFVGLLGPNGAGKTTLFQLLLGLNRPAQGSLKIFGDKPQKGNARIGYVPQRRLIDSELKIEALEYVRFGLSDIRFGFSLPNSAKQERLKAFEMLKVVDAEDLAYRSLSELSGGEMQRIFLAQALISNPDLLLLDEPLANLDIKRKAQLMQLMSRIIQKRNITVLLIVHDINPLLPVVDSIIYIANGKVASGKPQDIVTTERLSELYDSPIEVLRSPKGRIAVLGVEEAVHHNG